MALWLNIDSLTVDGRSLTATINGTVYVDTFDRITIIVSEGLSDMDISIPYMNMVDTRINPPASICVFQCFNYGLYITGKENPINQSLLQYNGDNRFEKRDGFFFGVLQPYISHSSTPVDGINLYSFAFYPEKQQPSGTSNFSSVDVITLSLWINEMVQNRIELFVFAFSYNIFKISSGMAGLMY
jgi:hypothetical protein